MSIAIGLICRGKNNHPEIVLASDSQGTYGATKRVNSNKLATIDFVNGCALVAQAGIVEVGDMVIEKMMRLAKGKTIENEETILQVAQAAIREVRKHLVDLNTINGVVDAQKLLWEEHKVDFLVAYYFDGKPLLYRLNIYRVIASPVKSFEAIGVGEHLGYYLLKEYSQADPDFVFGDLIATAIIEKVIENVDGCGLPTNVAAVFPMVPCPSAVSFHPSDLIENVVTRLKEEDIAALPAQRQKLLRTVKKIWGKTFGEDVVAHLKESLPPE